MGNGNRRTVLTPEECNIYSKGLVTTTIPSAGKCFLEHNPFFGRNGENDLCVDLK